MITAVFAFLFRRGIRGASILPRGDETISRVNSNMEALELGRPISPTRDQDVFAYRAEVKLRTFLGALRYKLEIGDFPGEDTVAFAEQYGDWLHRTNYFEWAISADAFVFVIDAGAVYEDSSGEYVARQKSALRAVWQRLQEHHLEGRSDLRRKPLILAFAKADLLLQRVDSRSYVPEPELIVAIDRAKERMMYRFADLIDYLRRESDRFEVILTSVICNIDGERLGVPTIAKHLMPRTNLFPSYFK